MKHRASLIIGLVLFVSLVYFLHEPALSAIGSFLVIQDGLQPVDVIHVLSGPDNNTGYAIRLYQQGYAKYLFFSGGWCEGHQVFHGAWGRENATAAGIPDDRIGSDDSWQISTYQEAEALKRWIDASAAPIRSVMVVSDPYHTRRSQWTFHQVLGEDVTLVMAPVPFDQTPFQKHWWTESTSRITVGKEYLKLIYYLARYEYSWGPVKRWLASLNKD